MHVVFLMYVICLMFFFLFFLRILLSYIQHYEYSILEQKGQSTPAMGSSRWIKEDSKMGGLASICMKRTAFLFYYSYHIRQFLGIISLQKSKSRDHKKFITLLFLTYTTKIPLLASYDFSKALKHAIWFIWSFAFLKETNVLYHNTQDSV